MNENIFLYWKYFAHKISHIKIYLFVDNYYFPLFYRKYPRKLETEFDLNVYAIDTRSGLI